MKTHSVRTVLGDSKLGEISEFYVAHFSGIALYNEAIKSNILRFFTGNLNEKSILVTTQASFTKIMLMTP